MAAGKPQPKTGVPRERTKYGDRLRDDPEPCVNCGDTPATEDGLCGTCNQYYENMGIPKP